MPPSLSQSIRLDADDWFVKTATLRGAYFTYERSRAPWSLSPDSDEVLELPVALQAGLGELGKHGFGICIQVFPWNEPGRGQTIVDKMLARRTVAASS